MPKKKKSEKHVHAARTTQERNVQRAAAIRSKNVNAPRWILPFILGVTFMAFIPALNAGFVNLDDGDYVTNNPILKNISDLKLLLTSPVQGNYHPLTMLSLSLNYMISAENAWSYHLFNIIF